MFELSLSSSGSTSSFLVSFKFFNLTKTHTACTSWFYVLLINNSQDRNTRITVNHKEILMIRRQTDFIVRTRLYLVHHLPFTGETRSWSPDIELGQRPRMDSNFQPSQSNSGLNHCAPLSCSGDHMLLAARSRLTPSSPACAPDVLCWVSPSVISLSIWCETPGRARDCRLAPGLTRITPAPVGDKFESWCCSHLGSPGQQPWAQASVRPLIRCLPPLPPTLRCVQSPRAQTIQSYQGFQC